MKEHENKRRLAVLLPQLHTHSGTCILKVQENEKWEQPSSGESDQLSSEFMEYSTKQRLLSSDSQLGVAYFANTFETFQCEIRKPIHSSRLSLTTSLWKNNVILSIFIFLQWRLRLLVFRMICYLRKLLTPLSHKYLVHIGFVSNFPPSQLTHW